MSDEHDILIDETGVHFVYDDALAEVFSDEPQQTTRRASHVEPARDYCAECRKRRDESRRDGTCQCFVLRNVFAPGWWVADMSPSGGPLLGAFPTRQAALDAERAWLREHKGL